MTTADHDHAEGETSPEDYENHVAELIERYRAGRNPTELSRDSRAPDGSIPIAMQNAYKLINATPTNQLVRFARMPTDATVIGWTRALGLGSAWPVLRAYALSSPRLRPWLHDETSLLEQELPPNVAVLDGHPELVADTARLVSRMARTILRLEERIRELERDAKG